MHALQFFPLLALGLELASRRLTLLRSAEVRRRVIWVSLVTFVATMAVLTWQALSAQSIVQPSGAILATGFGVAFAASIGLVLAVALPVREPAPSEIEYEIVS